MSDAAFANELASLINRASRENKSNTPDIYLADFMFACLQAFEGTTIKRDNHRETAGFLPNQRFETRIADLETQRQIEIERADFWATKCADLSGLLQQALPFNMGGTPDLFGPDCGWDEWAERVAKALGIREMDR